MNDAQAYGQEADRVFDSINLIQLNTSIERLMKLNVSILEKFIHKYSAIIIFYLAILDNQRKTRLLERMGEAAISYIIEEELRMLVLREITTVADDTDSFLRISGFVDTLGEEYNEESPLYFDAEATLKQLYRGRENLKLRHFEYLDSLSDAAWHRLADMLVKRNVNLAMGLLIYIPNRSASLLMDHLLSYNRLECLECVPEEIFRARISRGAFRAYARTDVLEVVPAGLRDHIRNTESILKENEEFIDNLQQKMSNIDLDNQDRSFRVKVMNGVYRQVRYMDDATRVILLAELVSRRILNEQESDMILKTVDQHYFN